MTQDTIHIVGFGSQGSTWAQCLRTSGWQVQIYLPSKERSFKKALELNFEPRLMEALPKDISSQDRTHWIAMLCPDSLIPGIYGDYIASSNAEVRLILAHGYAIYSKELKFRIPKHQAALLAPKAIGAKLLQNFKENYPQPHRLVAGFQPPQGEAQALTFIASALGFDKKSLVEATFEQEAIGDLISEQGLLCGGVMNLLLWTMEEMEKAGIPEGLIREECLTELELIAGMIRERGPAQTFAAISQAAQCGTIAMANRLEESGLREKFAAQAAQVRNREFVDFFNSSKWQEPAQKLKDQFSKWERRLEKK